MAVGHCRTLVIGLGNPLRGDDGVGPGVAGRLQARSEGRYEVMVGPPDVAELMEMWWGVDRLFVVDAITSGAAPGSIVRLEPGTGRLPAGWFRWSTHGLGIAEAIDLGRELGRLPERLIVFGVEAAGFEPGTPMSPAVSRAAEVVAARILAEIEAG